MIDDKKPQTLHTLSLKSLSPPTSVWSKTTLNTGGVGVAGVFPQVK